MPNHLISILYPSRLVSVGLLFFGLCLTGLSQKKVQEEADQFFQNKNYTKAFDLYTKLYSKKPEPSLLLKMADCSYFNENYSVAQKYYSSYFSDTVYKDLEQFEYYAKSSKKSGQIALASKLYQKIYENKSDPKAKYYYEIYKLYTDSFPITRCYNLDSNYNCLVLDASESVDPDAAPMMYFWDFGDGLEHEGLILEHCFAKEGLNKITLNIKDKRTGFIRYSDTALSVTIQSPPVKINFPKHVNQYLYFTYDASATTIPGYKILEYIWDMGNGDHLSGATIKYKFDKVGIYDLRLIVVAEKEGEGTKKLFGAYKTFEVFVNYNTNKKYGDR